MHLYMAVMAEKNQILRLQRQSGVLAHRHQVVYLQCLLDKVLAAKLAAAATQLVEKTFLTKKSKGCTAPYILHKGTRGRTVYNCLGMGLGRIYPAFYF